MANFLFREFRAMTHRIFNFSNNNGKLHCRVLGKGEKKVVAFHGFGQDGNVFKSLDRNQSKYTIYSFDLPFHGNTEIHDAAKCLSEDHVIAAIDELIQSENIQSFSLISFSMGAKLSFPVIQRFKQQIDCAWFLAPDGISNNFWYVAATKYRLMRRVFRVTMKKPQFLIKVGKTFMALNLMDKKTWLFVERILDSEVQRKRVYNTWVNLKCLGAISSKAKETFDGLKKVVFVVGEKDKVINSRIIQRTQQSIEQATLLLLPCGHHKLINCFSDWIKKEGAEL